MRAETVLPGTASSVPRARRFVASSLAGTDTGELTFTVALLVSELVSNAVLHAGTDVRVLVEHRDEVVRVEVSDTSARSVRSRRHRLDSGTGRGLLLVDRLSRSWGVDDSEGGKTVWFEIGLEGAAAAVELNLVEPTADSR